MNSTVHKPIYLFADSQLLFWKKDDQLFLKSVLTSISSTEPKAAYIGASNGDVPEYYQLFEGAMEGIGINECRMIKSDFGNDDENFLADADFILLAGGDVEKGWHIIQSSGMKEIILNRYMEGAVLTGISAGAVQLGMCAAVIENEKLTLLDTLQILPFIISAHEEKDGWHVLKEAVTKRNSFEKGIGIPAGGGFIYNTDHTIEPVRYSLTEIINQDGKIISNLLFPDDDRENSISVH